MSILRGERGERGEGEMGEREVGEREDRGKREICGRERKEEIEDMDERGEREG